MAEPTRFRLGGIGFLIEVLEGMIFLALLSAIWPGPNAVFGALSSPGSGLVLGGWIASSVVLVVGAYKLDEWMRTRKESRKPPAA